MGCGGGHHVLQQDGLAENRPVMDARAPVAVPARAHLEVEGAVHLVLFRAEDLGQMLRHLSRTRRDGDVGLPARAQASRKGAAVARIEGQIQAFVCLCFFPSLMAWDGDCTAAKLGLS